MLMLYDDFFGNTDMLNKTGLLLLLWHEFSLSRHVLTTALKPLYIFSDFFMVILGSIKMLRTQ